MKTLRQAVLFFFSNASEKSEENKNSEGVLKKTFLLFSFMRELILVWINLFNEDPIKKMIFGLLVSRKWPQKWTNLVI